MRILVIDGSSMLSTNYYGTLPREIVFAKTDEEKEKYYDKILQTSNGVYTNGVFTSLKQILRIIRYQRPDGIAVVFDKSRRTFRTDLYADYKGNRGKTPSPLKEQFMTFETILEKIGIPTFYSDDYEADDFAGSISRAVEQSGNDCILMSADKDYYQLVSAHTKLWRIIPTPGKAKYEKFYGINFDSYCRANHIPIGIFEVTDSTGIICDKTIERIKPESFIDYLAVVGDSADNIPGLPNVGPATIIPLLQKYDSCDEIYRVIEDAVENGTTKDLLAEWKADGIKKNPIRAFLDGKDNYNLSRSLAEIKRDIDVPINMDDYKVRIQKDKLAEVINEYEFESLKDFAK